MLASSTKSAPIAIVSGGGPAGALTAKILSDRGFSVQLYEAYPHPGSTDSKYKVEKSKAYVISIAKRGQLALKRCGIDPLSDLEGAVPAEAIVRHRGYDEKRGKGKSYVIRPEEGSRSVVVRRRALAASLLDAAQKSGAEIHCGWRLKDVDFENRIATFVERKGDTGSDGKETKVSYDLLVGADGVRSPTRTLLSQYVTSKGGSFKVRTLDDTVEYQVGVLPRPWKEIVLPEVANEPPLDTCPPASAHAWADTKLGSTALAFPLRDDNNSAVDKFLITIICPGGMLGEMKQRGFGGYTSALSALFDDWTPDSRMDLAQIFAEEDNIPSTGGVCVWTEALSHPESGVALVGDAGHGMWPSLGQGCNCALESVAVLADAVDAIRGPTSNGVGCRGMDPAREGYSHRELVRDIAAEYNGLRHEDAMAAVDLTFGGIGGTKVRGAPHSPIMFKAQVALFMILHKLTVGLVPMPAMMRIMKGEDVRYSILKWENKLERVVTYGFVLGLVALGVSRFI